MQNITNAAKPNKMHSAALFNPSKVALGSNPNAAQLTTTRQLKVADKEALTGLGVERGLLS
jgi:hypothetical protein